MFGSKLVENVRKGVEKTKNFSAEVEKTKGKVLHVTKLWIAIIVSLLVLNLILSGIILFFLLRKRV